ncbi:MAG TPA: SDR family oxidoreductase [Bacteroidales bacterium]|nr:SDR family oxidoreductase [Bacteroidales bacterium]
MEIFNLTGKTILVTGASSGIGSRCAVAVAAGGGRVFATGRDRQRLDRVFGELKGEGHDRMIADLTRPEQVEELVAGLPELNGVVYSLGITDVIPAQFVSEQDIDRNFSVGFGASVLLTATLLRKKKLVKNNCSLVFISSLATKYPFYGGGLYSAAKAALETYAKTLALELLPKRIRVNCVSPAFVKGPMMEETEGKISKEAMEKFLARQPLGLGEPEDVANAVVFLLSDGAKWITGANLPLGGA